jgi:hypothetical protein
LLVFEALLSAATTWLVIKAGRDVANGGDGLVNDLIWILVVQCASYAAGAVSWIYAERAGMRAFGLYINRFARDNRHYPTLLGRPARARAGRAVPDRRDVPHHLSTDVRGRRPAQDFSGADLQFDRAGHGDRRAPAP